MKNFALNLTLLLATCLIGLVLGELSLRFFYPKYEAAAEAEYELDEFRIWKRKPNARNTIKHPDTRVSHSVNHNNLGLRQARDFSKQEIRSAASIGFFGDSWTENIRMAAQASFTEPLDYLLNIAGEGGRTNVLNFGVDGYGPGQSFLHYKHFRYTKYLDYVFYVFCRNDLRNIYETDLFRLDNEGKLLQNVPPPPSPWVIFISRLHISYLFLDIARRLSVTTPENFLHLREDDVRQRMTELHKEKLNNMTANAIEEDTMDGNIDNQEHEKYIDIFKRIVFTWKKQVEGNEGKFYIVVLPVSSQRNIIPFIKDDFKIIDLYDCFSKHDTEFLLTNWGDSPYQFKNDSHWNEAGNRLAAICLYRFLEREMGLPVLSEDDTQEALERYYSAFEQSGQNPIRARYSALAPVQETD